MLGQFHSKILDNISENTKLGSRPEGAHKWQKGGSGSSMDSQKAPKPHISWTEICVPKQV